MIEPGAERDDSANRNGAIDPAPDQMGIVIREVFRGMMECLDDEFRDTDLAFSQHLALDLIHAGKIACVGDVNRALGLDVSTRLVDQLEKRKLLVRERSHNDRRIVGLSLTSRGIETVLTMRPRFARFWDRQLSGFSSAEREQLLSLLMRLRDEWRTPQRPCREPAQPTAPRPAPS
ncbi:MarR family winged helix-turn-helix transcriptional regulator [Sphingobium yanoikuyae]|uniref:MarR family winged helix-turn-helix transcriptional regulator n=1 Tax=Sphingobium yanoikuyae TaxID=13690 RepID=UPI00068AC034|nr:MarR family transcriptional regulator [Sphingobium yanoikuyae]MDV3480068.1 MarR family transcriptional regulator [Sphingobium yanoikuyae]